MKTFLQIAEEIGASKQAVYKRYKGKLYKTVLPYARNVDGTIYILEQGESVIKQDFLNDTACGGAHREYAPDDEMVYISKTEVEFKNQLIMEQQETIKELATASKKTRDESASRKTQKRKVSSLSSSPKSAPIGRLFKGMK